MYHDPHIYSILARKTVTKYAKLETLYHTPTMVNPMMFHISQNMQLSIDSYVSPLITISVAL